jgi:hypothetical protein
MVPERPPGWKSSLDWDWSNSALNRPQIKAHPNSTQGRRPLAVGGAEGRWGIVLYNNEYST